MSPLIRPHRLATLVVLTFVWCALWGEATVGNVITGLALAIGVTALGVGTSGLGGIRLLPLLRLAWLVCVDLVKSTASVALETVTPQDRTEESIVAVEVGRESRDHMLLLIVAVTLTPGTAVVDADPDTGTLYLHLLHDHRRIATREHVEELSRLACQALPTTTRTQTP